jgi:predicted lipoprotein with Yx(FWY)xxD motif
VRFGLVACGALLVLTITAATSGAVGAGTTTTVVGVVRTRSGAVLATGSGRTLYVFVDDLLTREPSACTGDCAHDWIPMRASGRIVVRGGVTGRVGSVMRTNGERQLTMDGRPLYTFSGDEVRGDTRGNGVGNLWWAMTPSGLTATAYPQTASTYGPAGATTLTVVQTRFGPAVANARGAVLYTYADDRPTESACVADWCLVDWPPLQASGVPTKSVSISAPTGVIRGAGGTTQVTLAGHPLYTFAGDLHPGDARGQGIGGDWYLISPTGRSVHGGQPDDDRPTAAAAAGQA